MMAYSGGDNFPCVVAEVGSYSTKMGFAGEDYPRSYFQSTSAILREQDKCQKGKIINRSYDLFNRPLDGIGNGDGDWEICNPIDLCTGLLYEAFPATSDLDYKTNSHNSNDDASGANSSTDEFNTRFIPGECYFHFSSYLTHGFRSALGTEDSSATPFLLIERSYNPPPIRQKLLEILFEQQSAPATFLARDAVCACYAVGRTTGTVVDIGFGGTVVSPVYEGFVENKGIFRSPAGGQMMDGLVLENLDQLYRKKKARLLHRTVDVQDYVMPLYQTRITNKKRREPYHTLARQNMARLCKEDGSGAGVAAFGYASMDAEFSALDRSIQSDLQQNYINSPNTPYKLPDGTVVDIPQIKRFDVAELLFGKDEINTRKRDEAVHKRRKRLNAIVSSGTVGVSSDGNQTGKDSKLTHLKNRRASRENSIRVGDLRYLSTSYTCHHKLVDACHPHLSSSIGELTSSTIPNMICDSAFKCDRDQQSQLLGNVVLCGGGACLSKTSALSSSSTAIHNGNSMTDRIREEVEGIVHTHTPGWRVKVLSSGLTERAVCSWLGGSILGSLGSFHEMWITKKEYEEHGASIVNRKCP